MFKVDSNFLPEVLKLLNKDEKMFNEDVAIITTWMKQQPHFPEVLDKRMVQNFLILTKFNIETTKERIDFYFTSKTLLDDFFSEVNPKLPHMKEFRQIDLILPHPQLFNNNRVGFIKMGNKELGTKLEPLNVIKHFFSAQEMRLREDVMFGDILIIDCTDFPLSFYVKFTPSILHKTVLGYQKLYSNRLTACYLINFHPLGESLLKFVKQIIKPKIAERIHLLPNNEALRQYFPEDYLPPEFGGKGISMSTLQEMFEDELRNHQELFDHLDTIRVDENLRPEALKNDDFLGYYGSFRKLNVD